MKNKTTPLYSFVIPAHNEEGNLAELLAQITEEAAKLQLHTEIIVINDGSTDNTLATLLMLKKSYPDLKIIDFNTRYGKSSALQAGFSMVQGEYVFTMDADLQDDPAEFRNFITKMEQEKLDMVSGWKFVRHDEVGKTLPSKIANTVMRKMSGVKIHDMNCGFKLYTRKAIQSLLLYGDMHRFIPAVLGAHGYKIGEIKVNHRARKSGVSKFGTKRLITSGFDFLTILLVTKYLQKPLHFFGLWGIVFATLSFISLMYLFYLWAFLGEAIGTRPLFIFSLFMMGLGIQITILGLIAELVIRNNSKDTYIIRQVY